MIPVPMQRAGERCLSTRASEGSIQRLGSRDTTFSDAVAEIWMERAETRETSKASACCKSSLYDLGFPMGFVLSDRGYPDLLRNAGIPEVHGKRSRDKLMRRHRAG